MGNKPPLAQALAEICEAFVGSRGKTHGMGGPRARVERCRSRASIQRKYQGRTVRLCRLHDNMTIDYLEMAPTWWMSPEELLGHVTAILRRASQTEQTEILILNLTRRIS